MMIDYGEHYTQEDSLRGYKNHTQVSILSEPGHVDVTADVDFFACSQVFKKADVAVVPLLTQKEFLLKMGLLSRVEKLLEQDSVTEEQAEIIVEQCKKLIGDDPSHMGQRFKVLICTYPALDIPSLV